MRQFVNRSVHFVGSCLETKSKKLTQMRNICLKKFWIVCQIVQRWTVSPSACTLYSLKFTESSHIYQFSFLSQGTLFVAFVCFAVASTPKYLTATLLEFLITLLLLLLYLLKLNKRITFLFWPIVVSETLPHSTALYAFCNICRHHMKND